MYAYTQQTTGLKLNTVLNFRYSFEFRVNIIFVSCAWRGRKVSSHLVLSPCKILLLSYAVWASVEGLKNLGMLESPLFGMGRAYTPAPLSWRGTCRRNF